MRLRLRLRPVAVWLLHYVAAALCGCCIVLLFQRGGAPVLCLSLLAGCRAAVFRLLGVGGGR